MWAFDIDCIHMKNDFGLPDGASVPGGKGFLVIRSDRPLDVVAVYTTKKNKGGGISIDVEYIKPKVAPVAPPPPTPPAPTPIPPTPIPPTPAPPGQPIPAPAGMVGWWSGDGHPNDIIDGNHGTLQGDGTFAAGMVGQAFSLDGDGDWIELVGASALGLIDSDFTVDAWVNLSNPRHIDPVLGTPDALHLAAAHGGQRPYMGFWVNDTSGTTVISPNTWYHLAWRYTKSTGEQAIFVNGARDGGGTGHAPFQGTGIVYIGRSVGSQPFTGLIDEVGIYNRPLSDTEIKAIYDAGSAGKIKPAP